MDTKYRELLEITNEEQYNEVRGWIEILLKEATEKGFLENTEVPNKYTAEISRLGKLCVRYEDKLGRFDHLRGEPTHPSEILRDAMEERGETQKGLAEKLGISKSYLNEILNGKKDINANISVKLESVWGIPAEFWLKFQMKYNIHKAREKQRDTLEKLTSTRKQRNNKAKKETATA